MKASNLDNPNEIGMVEQSVSNNSRSTLTPTLETLKPEILKTNWKRTETHRCLKPMDGYVESYK